MSPHKTSGAACGHWATSSSARTSRSSPPRPKGLAVLQRQSPSRIGNFFYKTYLFYTILYSLLYYYTIYYTIYYTTLYDTTRYYTILYDTTLHYTSLYYTLLCFTIYYTILYHAIL